MITWNNRKLEFSSQNISNDGGIVLLTEFFNNIKLVDKLSEIPFTENRTDPYYSNADIIYNRIVNSFCGYNSQVLAEKAKYDNLFTNNMKTPCQSTFSRFYKRINGFTNCHLNRLVLETAKPLLKKQDILILDADSTYVECNGKQECSARNAHYNCHGFNPIFITEHNTKTVLAAELKPGNTVCSDCLENLLNFIHEEMNLKNKKIIFRADSAFSNSKHLTEYDDKGYDYRVKLRRNKSLINKIEEIMINNLIASDDMVPGKEHYITLNYSSKSYNSIRLYVKGITEIDDQVLLFPEYQVIASNIEDSPENIFALYNERACSENIFRELKNDFNMDTLSHTSFEQNRFDFLISCFNYNLFQLFKHIAAYEMKSKTLGVFIREFIKIGTKITYSARQYSYKFSSNYRYKNYFRLMFNRLKL